MPQVEISNGELLDRYSILLIKSERLTNQVKVLAPDLESTRGQAGALLGDPGISSLFADLLAVNQRIWDAMQAIYDWRGNRNDEFVSHVFAIIEENQERARIKRAIDVASRSTLREAKSFFADTEP
jgi:hypothetical protein